jgi:transcriptional regulator GlxA family with amidase domain
MRYAAALLYPDALATSVTLPMEILHAASQMAGVAQRGRPQGRFALASTDGSGPVTLGSGLRLPTEGSLQELPALDLLILPAIWRSPQRTLRLCSPLLPELQRRLDAGTRLCSVGTASCLLAEAGLLEGRSATTHWNHFEHFARRYPNVALKRRHLITQSGRIYCAGSVNSIADLMVHIVENWYGPRIARAIEAQFSPESRRTFASAAFLEGGGTAHHDEAILDAQSRLRERLAEPLGLGRLAAEAGLSERTFTRRFRRATGLSPLQYQMRLRIGEARSLLQHSNLGISDIAWRCGWQSASLFSRQFRQRVGLSPRAFRAAVRGKRFAAEATPPP